MRAFLAGEAQHPFGNRYALMLQAHAADGLLVAGLTEKLAAQVEQAQFVVVDKLNHALSHQFGKLRNKRAQAPLLEGDLDTIEDQDTLLEEDFLAEQQVRSA